MHAPSSRLAKWRRTNGKPRYAASLAYLCSLSTPLLFFFLFIENAHVVRGSGEVLWDMASTGNGKVLEKRDRGAGTRRADLQGRVRGRVMVWRREKRMMWVCLTRGMWVVK